MAKNSTGAEHVRWDLGILYSGLDDPQIDADVHTLVEKCKNFSIVYRGKLRETLSGAILDYAEMSMLQDKIMLFLYLNQSTNVADVAIKAKIAEVERIMSEISGEYMTFFMIELVALDDEVLTNCYATNPLVARHRSWIEHCRVFKPHLLSEPVESALIKRSPFGSGAWSEFFDELEADIEGEFQGEKKTLTELLHLLSESKNKDERTKLLQVINDSLKGTFAKYSAQTLYMVAGATSVENRERSYKHPMEGANKSNQIPDTVVDVLHETVNRVAGPLARRYYRLKAALLGLPILGWGDRNAPMPFSDTTTIPFDTAKGIVLAAYESFSPTSAELVKTFFDQNHIDAPGIRGKRGGAFNYSVVLPGSTPVSYVFLNYLGSSRDVMTLAHELGHGVHGLLAGKAQGALMFHAPTAYCETASVFGEMTTFNFLKEQLVLEGDKKSLLALVMGKIDDVINTAVRQISFSNFERRLHGMDSSYQTWSEPKKFSVEELNVLWLETTKELYGVDGDVFTYENADHLWSYISHFHRPFYVYGYAFGELLTQSLYAKQAVIGDRFEPLYLDLLKSGSTKNVIELLAPFGLDPTRETFWVDGIDNGLGAMVLKAEALAHELGLLH
ncbi:MAG: M3 family oligoendopeptidase [Parcubacteria group bacterium]|nr:M3 family oligoendopeptidase [Parcubacteria group bacterium]